MLKLPGNMGGTTYVTISSECRIICFYFNHCNFIEIFQVLHTAFMIQVYMEPKCTRPPNPRAKNRLASLTKSA